MLVRFGPLCGDPAPAHDVARLHLEDVGEVAAQRDLELESHRLHAVVGDVEIFVQAAADRPADGEAERARRDRAVFGEQRAIGEKDAGGIVADGAAIQQFPGFAVGIDGPAADDAGIEEIETLFARPVDLPVLLADQHRLTLVDGDLRWADLDLERHEVLPLWSARRAARRRGRVPAPRVYRVVRRYGQRSGPFGRSGHGPGALATACLDSLRRFDLGPQAG